MIQPYLRSIKEEGELSLFYFALNHSHTIVKKPAQNDFRVQEDYEGTFELTEPPAELLAFAEKALLAVPGLRTSADLMYARVDVAKHNGEYCLIELELIEPSLYFNAAPGSGDRFADAFAKTFNRRV